MIAGPNLCLLRFSTTNTIQESAIILPQPDSGFGIAISPNASMHPLIEMNAPIHFKLATGRDPREHLYGGAALVVENAEAGAFFRDRQNHRDL
ncbi:Uncharacterised protein [Klebsiella pneumoniae]|nr:Uncharacterised protein [Klebsiella pneumoniae]